MLAHLEELRVVVVDVLLALEETLVVLAELSRRGGETVPVRPEATSGKKAPK